MLNILEKINGFVWGVPAIVLIVGIGLYLSVRTGFAQIRFLPKAVRLFFTKLSAKDKNLNGVSPYQALCTALAATVGTGNLAGVAGAIAIGGPGTVFWMWICGILGMVIKCAEAALAVRFREKRATGEYVGGPMYIIQKGMGRKWRFLAVFYCFFGVVAAFGAGNATQINAMTGGINSMIYSFGGMPQRWLNWGIGIASGMVVVRLLSGGAKRIGQTAEKIVPFACILYMVMGLGVLVVCHRAIPNAFRQIIAGAFSPKAVTGGVISSIFIAVRTGASRGVFTNEAGMGTASIAHAAAQVAHPMEQGLMGIIEVFVDTLLICTLTALVILCSGVSVNFGIDVGVSLTTDAFSAVYGDWISIPIALILSCFAFATVLGWGLYGARCAEFLFGKNSWKKFAWISGIMVVAGAVLNTGTVWLFSETVNGLMVIPNLIAMAWLSPEFIRLMKEYRAGV